MYLTDFNETFSELTLFYLCDIKTITKFTP